MKRELLTYKEPKSPVSEIFRTLRTNIQFMNTDKKLKTLLVTSTFPEEGKSWITANLAVTFAQAGKKVILIDADMRKGRQFNIFNILPKPGLSNYLSNMDSENMEVSDVNITNYIQQTNVENLSIISAGNVPPNPSELLVSAKMRELLKQLKEMCDLVIIDGTPCDLVTDSIILSRYVDSTIVVAVPKKTKKENLSRIVKNIKNVGGKIAGVVVNKVNMPAKKYNESYYYGSISGNSLNRHQKKSGRNDQMMESFLKYNIDKLSDNEETEQFEVSNNSYIDTEEKTPEETIELSIPKTVETSAETVTNEKASDFIEVAPSAKNMSKRKADEIINLVNNYVEEEKQKRASEKRLDSSSKTRKKHE